MDNNRYIENTIERAKLPDLAAGRKKETIFVDFDDTLCLHSSKVESWKYLFLSPKYITPAAYGNSKPNTALHIWLNEKQTVGAKIYLITAASSTMLEAKKLWLDDCYKDILFADYLSVSIDAGKADHLKAYTELYPDEQLYFIDDDPSDRFEVKETCPGVIVISPQQLMENAQD